MQRLSPQDASFLHLEDAVSHMQIGSVAILEGPRPGMRRSRDGLGAPAGSRATGRRSISCRSRSAGRCGWTIRTSTWATTCAARRSRRRAARGVAQAGRARHVPAARPYQAVVGDVGRRGPQRGAVGAHRQDASLHGRRRLRGGAPGGDARHRARSQVPRTRRVASRAPASGAELAVRRSPRGGSHEQLRSVGPRCAPGPCGQDAAATARGLWAMTGVVPPPPPSSLNGPIGPIAAGHGRGRSFRTSSASAMRSAEPSMTWF